MISPNSISTKRLVGIYKLRYPIPSETFISSQALALTDYEPLILTRKRCGATDLPTLAVSDHDQFGVRQALLALTGSPSFFLKDERVRKLSLIHAHFGMNGVYGLQLAERLTLPLVVTFHGLDATMRRWPLFTSLFGLTVMNYFRSLCRLKERGAAFIAVSDFIHGCLVTQGFSPEKIHRLYIGVDTRRFCPLPESSEGGEGRYLLNVARHVPVKGVATLLRAFARLAARHPQVKLMQVGAGPLTESLHRLSRELGIADRVKFLGSLSHGDVLTLMQRAEIVALTSETARSGAREALGMVLNEASACAVPVVATCCGGIPEAVIHGKTGLLSPERDDHLLAENLELLLADGELRRRIGRRGRELVCEKFCLRKQTAELERLYDRLVEGK